MAKKFTKQDLQKGLSRVSPYILENKNEIILLSILSGVVAFAGAIMPYFMGKLFDALVSHKEFNFNGLVINAIIIFLIAWFLTQLFSFLLRRFIGRRNGILTWKLYTDYIVKIYNYLLFLPLSFHKGKRIGSLSNNVWKGANAISIIVSDVMVGLASDFFTVFLALVFSFILNKILALVMLGGIIFYSISLYKVLQEGATAQRSMQKAWNTAFQESYDAVENINAVKQTTSEEYEQSKNKNNFKIANFRQLMVQLLRVKTQLLENVTVFSTLLCVFVISIYFISKGTMTVGQLITFNAYVALLFNPFLSLGNQWRSIQNGIIDLEQTEKVLGLKAEDYSPKNEIKLNKINGHIRFENVFFGYENKNNILENINFEVFPGEIVALVGESGVGKSTLIELLSGYHFAKKGRIVIDGVNIKQINLTFLRKNIGVVPQEVVLFNDTIEMNLKYGALKTNKNELYSVAKKAHAYDFIEKFPKKWSQLVGSRGIKLSVGQKQRVAIARAFLRKPKILILDEPTSALDAGSEKIITESLEELMKEKTTFIIAHRLSTVRRADKILVFKDGKIIESGKHNELLTIKNGEYRRLYELQIGLHN